MVLLMSVVTDPENFCLLICPPYDTKEAVEGEKAMKLPQRVRTLESGPTEMPMVRVVPCRLVGAVAN